MKTKVLTFLTCLMLACVSAFCLTACNFGNDSGSNPPSAPPTLTIEDIKKHKDYIAEEDGSVGLEYELLESGNYSVSIGTCTEAEIKIPSLYKGKRVEEIDDFSSSRITLAIIGFGVSSISSGAFGWCNFTSIEIPDSVTSIGNRAFDSCKSLQSVTIGDGVTNIGYSAFRDCASLTEIVIPDSVTSIGDSAFCDCTSLTEIIMPDSVTSIGYFPFENTAYYNNEANWENGVLYIDNYLIDSKYAISSKYTIKNGTVLIADLAFSGNHTLTEITIPKSVKIIGKQAFYCENLKKAHYLGTINDWAEIEFGAAHSNPLYNGGNLYINDKIVDIVDLTTAKKINAYAFYNGDAIKKVIIPNSVTSIGNEAFNNCDSLNNIEVAEDNTNYKDVDGNLYSKDGKTLIQYALGKTATKFEIPDSVTSIGNYAFCGCSSLTSIEIPAGVTSIGNYAFCDCSSLTSIEIPAGVTNIGNSAFKGCDNLKTVNFLGSIDDWAQIDFGSAYSNPTYFTRNLYINGKLVTEVILTTATKISDFAFNQCRGVKKVEISNTVTSIGNYAFHRCNLDKINIPNSVTSIGRKAFFQYASYTESSYIEVYIPSSVTYIGESAFDSYDATGVYKCESQSQPISWHGSWKSYSKAKIIWDCDNNEVTEDGYIYKIIDGIRYLLKDGEATVVTQFKDTTSAIIQDSINYNNNDYIVKSIIKSAFESCTSLTSVVIGNSVTSIGEDAFYGCFKLVEVINKSKNITVEKGLSNNGYLCYYALSVSNCDSTYVSKLTNDNGFVIYTDGQEKILVAYNGAEANLVIPNYVTKINSYAFNRNDKIKNVTIGNGVTSIGERGFYGCSSLQSITIGDSVTSISSEAFYDCSSLKYNVKGNLKYLGNSSNPYLYLADTTSTSITTATIDSNCKIIGDDAFEDCSKLTSIEIPDSVTSIGSNAFEDCSKLTSIEIPDSVTSIGSNAFRYCYSLSSVTIGNGVTSIGFNAFYDCDSLSSVTIGNGVTSIGSNAFYDCDSLSSVTIGNGVTSIGYQAFYSCDSLTSIVIPDSVTSIGKCAFEDCSKLTSIVIPDSVTSIGNYAFYDCSSLKYNVKGNLKYLGNSSNPYLYLADTTSTSITTATIDSNCKIIGDNAFEDCSKLTSIEIPDSVTSIGYNAFFSCDLLTSVTIGNGVTSIGDDAFRGCTSLQSVTIGSGVTSIGDYAFYGCSALKNIIFEDTSNWYVTTSYTNWLDKKGGSLIDLTNIDIVAYFNTNKSYYFYKL